MAEVNMDQETRDLIKAFVQEGLELIEHAELQVESLDVSEPSQVITTVFRLFHSLKGSAGYLNFNNIQAVTHEAEALLTLFRQGKAGITRQHAALLIEAIDFLRQLIDAVDTHLSDGVLSSDTAPMVRKINDLIRVLETSEQSENPTVNSPTNTQQDDPQPDDPEPDFFADDSRDPDQRRADYRTNPSQPSQQSVYDDQDDSHQKDPGFIHKLRTIFAEEARDSIQRAQQLYSTLSPGQDNSKTLKEVLRDIHTLKGNASVLTFNDLVEKLGEFETILIRMQEGQVGITKPTLELMQEELDLINTLVDQHCTECETAGISLDLTQVETSKSTDSLTKANEPSTSKEQSTSEKQSTPQEPSSADQRSMPEDLLPKSEGQSEKSPPLNESTSTGSTVRIPTERLDRLFELVGELITAESMVLESPDLLGLHLPVFQKRAANLVKLTRELHEVALMVRMLPLDTTFLKMKRLARDTARRLGKVVAIEIQGEDTEMDKTVIEQISDPLVHLIRNAVDHGIETPEERTQAGKNPEGLLEISSWYEGNEIVLQVKDDGKGLDRKKILEKAQEKSLIFGSGDDLTDQEVFQFIFHPGFSTRDQVSDVSGRGVGMDVVKTNIEKARGHIFIDSTLGKGTSITLRIPITLAIIDTVTVQVQHQHYSVDLTDVQEFIRLDKVPIVTNPDSQKMVDLRNRMIPLYQLETLMFPPENLGVIELEDYEHSDQVAKLTQSTDGTQPTQSTTVSQLAGAAKSVEATTGMILTYGDREFCVPVDRIVGTQQTVVKPLPDFTGQVAGISGMSILSTGNLTFILDVRGLTHKLFTKHDPAWKAEKEYDK
jgi:two-component system chemotaxis sensor kinase CheA